MMNTAITEQFFNRTFVPAMSEGDAWREAARRIAEGEFSHGICLVLFYMRDAGRISSDVYGAMVRRIDAAKRERDAIEPLVVDTDYLWPSGQCADERALYCLLMGEMWEDGR